MFIGNKLDLIRDLDSEIFTSESIPILKKEEILTKFYSSKYSSLIGNISEQCEKIKIPLIEAYGSSLEFGILKKKFFKFTKLIHNGFEIRDGSLKTFHEWYYGGK